MQNGQGSLEFMFIIGAAIIVFAVLMVFVVNSVGKTESVSEESFDAFDQNVPVAPNGAHIIAPNSIKTRTAVTTDNFNIIFNLGNNVTKYEVHVKSGASVLCETGAVGYQVSLIPPAQNPISFNCSYASMPVGNYDINVSAFTSISQKGDIEKAAIAVK